MTPATLISRSTYCRTCQTRTTGTDRHSSSSDRIATKPAADPWTTDPENPTNWPNGKKIFHTFIPAFAAFICTLASSIYTPGRNSLIDDFGVSQEVSLLPYVLYVLGLGFGPLVASPISETLGRRAVYMVSLPIFALFILGSGFSRNIASLCVCRFFAGFFGSPGLGVGTATLSDVWLPAQRAVPMAVYVMTPFLGPAVGKAHLCFCEN